MREPLWLSGRSVCCLRAFIVMTSYISAMQTPKSLFIPSHCKHCPSLGLTKTDYEMRFNHEGHSTHNPSVSEIWNETSWQPNPWHGCQNLGTAYEFSTRVGHGTFFFIFHALSFELNFCFNWRFPLKYVYGAFAWQIVLMVRVNGDVVLYCIRALKQICKDSEKMVTVNIQKTIQHRFAEICLILEIKWLFSG